MTEAITDNSDEARFELHSGGELAALLAYKREDGLLALTHAETRDGFTGQGAGPRSNGAIFVAD